MKLILITLFTAMILNATTIYDFKVDGLTGGKINFIEISKAKKCWL